MLGVIITAALTYGFAIPANNDHWRVEITKRGGGTWYLDKNGRLGWMWTVEPTSETRPQKRIIVPSSQSNVRSGRL
jgi:hypothetical protein